MTLTDSEVRHLHRLLGWVSCEIGQAPDELVDTVQHIAGKINDPISQDAKARLVQAHAEAANVPHYVRTAVKALRKRLAAPQREPNWQPEFDAVVPEQERPSPGLNNAALEHHQRLFTAI